MRRITKVISTRDPLGRSVATRRVAGTICCLLAIWAVEAQQATQNAQTPSNGTVKFQTSTQLVIETVSVADKNGKPIEGLTAKDFTVTEDGVAQTISFCEFQKLEELLNPVTEPVAVPAAAP